MTKGVNECKPKRKIGKLFLKPPTVNKIPTASSNSSRNSTVYSGSEKYCAATS